MRKPATSAAGAFLNRLVLWIAFVSVLMLQRSASNGQSLSGAYGRAQDIIHSFKGSAGGSRSSSNLSDSTWNPSFGSLPSQPAPPSPLNAALDKEVKKHEERISKLTGSREAWRVASENLQSGKNWQSELQYWVEDSQTAQFGALTSSLGLLVGTAGPLEEAITVHQENAAVFWNSAQKARSKLEDVNALLAKSQSATNTVEARRAADALRLVYDDLTAAMKTEDALIDRYKRLETIADGVVNAAEWIERVKDLKEKHTLLLAAKQMADCAVDPLYDAALKKLVAQGLTDAARVSRLGKFAIDYGYQSMRFYLAWSNVHDILGHMDDQTGLSAIMDWKIVETTNQINSLRSEKQRIQKARDNKPEGEAILAEMRQKELRDAYFAGEWFSEQTGIRAPGEPILQDSHP